MQEKKVLELPIDIILPNRFQPRIKYDDVQIYELSESIKNHGVFQPIIVRRLGDKYEIIAGERRYKASVLAGKPTIPAIVMELDDKNSIEIALIENVQRANLTPIEEAISYKKILDMGYIKQEDLANKLGKTQSTIANKIRLLNLDEDVQDALLENKISERHARSLLKLKNTSDQKEMLSRIINERLTVRKTDEEINKIITAYEETPIVIEEVIEKDKNMNNNDNNQSNIQVAQNTMLNSSVIDNENRIIDESKVNQTVVDPYSNLQNMTQTAQQINQERPLNDVSKLLNVDPINTAEIKEEPKQEYRMGRFFNIPVQNDNNQNNDNEAKNFSFDNLYEKVDSTKNNIVNEYSTPNLNFGSEVPTEIVEEEDNNSNFNVENIFNQNDIQNPNVFEINDGPAPAETEIPSNIFNQTEKYSSPEATEEVNQTMATDVVDEDTNNIFNDSFDAIPTVNNEDSIPSLNQSIMPVTNENDEEIIQPIAPITTEEITMPEVTEEDSQPITSVVAKEDSISPMIYEENDVIDEDSIPTVTPVAEVGPNFTEPEVTPIYDSNIPQSDIIDTTSVATPEVINNSVVETNDTDTAEEVQPVNNDEQDNEAVKAIKDAIDLLKSKGFKIDYDEYDLETMNQIIVKIQK